eukprot:Skav236697  [mRNA]  locus=scaffold4101:93018:93839:- [translate_table: standard]
MSTYFADLLDDGSTYNDASYTLFGYIILRSNEDIPERSLYPRARQALKGWSVRYPQCSRTGADPLIWYLLADEIAGHSVPLAAAMLLQLDTYARPSKILGLRLRDIVRPVSKHCKFWGIIIGISLFDETTKTGTQDDTVLLDSEDRPYVEQVLAHVIRHCKRKDDLLFPHASLSSYEAACRTAKKNVGLGKFDLSPHCVRHSGPSADFLSKSRCAAEIMARGRWKALKSVQRYQKPGQMMAKMNKIPPDVWKLAKTSLPAVLRKIRNYYGASP